MEEEEKREKAIQLEQERAHAALLESNKIPPREISTTINDYGVVLARTWHEEEAILVLENGKVLGIHDKNPCWVPACKFSPVKELEGHYILQASWARGKWRALDRSGRSLIFKIPHVPSATSNVSGEEEKEKEDG